MLKFVAFLHWRSLQALPRMVWHVQIIKMIKEILQDYMIESTLKFTFNFFYTWHRFYKEQSYKDEHIWHVWKYPYVFCVWYDVSVLSKHLTELGGSLGALLVILKASDSVSRQGGNALYSWTCVDHSSVGINFSRLKSLKIPANSRPLQIP